MNVKEFAVISLAIKSSYPWANIMPDEASKDIWYGMLKDLDYKAVSNAVQTYIATNKQPPSIADIRSLSAEAVREPVIPWEDGWHEVQKAIRFQGYMNEQEALNDMSEITKRCVKRIGWQNICMSENPTADRANFRMMYENYEKEQKRDNQIPIAVKRQRMDLLEQSILSQLEAKAGDN